MALEVYLVRHGKTVFNMTGRLQGWSDSPLTAEGRAVALQLGCALRKKVAFSAAFSSNSPRALDTAGLILSQMGLAHLPVTVIEEMREYCFGGFEGERLDNIHEIISRHRGYASTDAWLEAYRNASSHVLAQSVSELDPLGLAETEEAFHARLQQGLKRLVSLAPESGKILLVSHGMAITSILKSIDRHSILYKSVKNATVSRLVYKQQIWKIESVGEEWV